MSNSSNPCVRSKSIILVPYWVKDALHRAKLPMSSVLDYGVMADLMSIEDRSAFLNIQCSDKISLFSKSFNGYLLGSWEQSAQGEQKAVLVSAVVPMSYSESAQKDTFERLELGDKTPSNKYWEILDFDRSAVAVILNPGIFEVLKDKTEKLNMVRDILSVFYGYYEVHEVSQMNLFGEYLNLL